MHGDLALVEAALSARAFLNLVNQWLPRRPVPASDAWFEAAWAAFREGEIYR